MRFRTARQCKEVSRLQPIELSSMLHCLSLPAPLRPLLGMLNNVPSIHYSSREDDSGIITFPGNTQGFRGTRSVTAELSYYVQHISDLKREQSDISANAVIACGYVAAMEEQTYCVISVLVHTI